MVVSPRSREFWSTRGDRSLHALQRRLVSQSRPFPSSRPLRAPQRRLSLLLRPFTVPFENDSFHFSAWGAYLFHEVVATTSKVASEAGTRTVQRCKHNCQCERQ